MIKKKLLLVVLILIAVLSFTSCTQLDVVGNTSITSFKKVLEAIPDKIAEDEVNNSWSLSAPDDSARFIWSKDFSKSSIDVMLEFDAKPFIDAGMDVSKLPDGMYNNDKITVGSDLGNDIITYNEQATPLASYEQIVKLKRDKIKYHSALDHFGVDLSNGNVFEWAKDMSKNDKDIVFALNPQIFIDAGVDIGNVKGWTFAKVKTMDSNGKPIEVDKLLKPFNLK